MRSPLVNWFADLRISSRESWCEEGIKNNKVSCLNIRFSIRGWPVIANIA
jgi:hypothetical protein